MKPYYSEAGIEIYHGDAHHLLAELAFDCIVTDPPYGHGKNYGDGSVDGLVGFRAASKLIAETGKPAAQFLSASRIFDLPERPQWMGVWNKLYGASGLIAYPFYPHWDAIAFYNIKGDYAGNNGHRSDVFDFAPIRPVDGGHPTPKPLDLMCELVRFMRGEVLCDPFVGSGTTLEAAKLLGRRAIGIEICEKFCEVAAKRLAQGVLFGAPAE
jgi:site-specific DNA-methyltransferase (adenine-specific)